MDNVASHRTVGDAQGAASSGTVHSACVNRIFICETNGYIDDGGSPITAFLNLERWVGDFLEIASDTEWKLDIKCILDEFDWEEQLEDEDAWQKMPSYYI